MKFLWIAIVAGMVALSVGMQKVWAFNLIQDIDAQTNWDVGKAVAAGTSLVLKDVDAVNAKNGQFIGSALAEIADYRFLSLWGGGTFIPQSDGSLKALDTGKIGINLAYFFKSFVNQPPAIISNLVIGPSLATSIVSQPRVLVPSIDVNYKFGS